MKKTTTNRYRRSKMEILNLETEIYNILSSEYPMTLRQLFYRLVSNGTIEKKENEYNAIIERTKQMRLSNKIPFYFITDSTRWTMKPNTYSSLAKMLKNQQQLYRRSLWDDQPEYIEIWSEKDAISSVLYTETERYDIGLHVTRGYASLTYLMNAAETIRRINKPTTIYFFGDRDPSGVDIQRNVEKRLREFAPKAIIDFVLVAVTEQQIVDFKLLTRPTKQTDSRAKTFVGDSVEVDAIPPLTLRKMAKECIEKHLDFHQLALTQKIEDEEKEVIDDIIKNYSDES